MGLVGVREHPHRVVGEDDAGPEVPGELVGVQVLARPDESRLGLPGKAKGAQELQPLTGRGPVGDVGPRLEAGTAVVLAARDEGERATHLVEAVAGRRRGGDGFPLHTSPRAGREKNHATADGMAESGGDCWRRALLLARTPTRS